MNFASNISTAVRELMSRRPPSKSTSPVRLAHTELVATLAGNIPHPIYAEVDSDDLDGRADHLEKMFAALHDEAALVRLWPYHSSLQSLVQTWTRFDDGRAFK